MAIPVLPIVFIAAARYGARALGIGVVTFVGIEALLETTRVFIIGNISNGIAGDLAGLLGLFGIDTAISMILSAFAIKGTMWAASKFVFRS